MNKKTKTIKKVLLINKKDIKKNMKKAKNLFD